MSRNLLLTALLAIASGALSEAAAPRPAPSRQASLAENMSAGRGLAFARRHCAACHGVDVGQSPNPAAPPFEAIVNTPGLTVETLGTWLRDSHNYPEIMAFEVDQAQVSDLSAYMLTLKDPSYRPAIQ